MAKKKIFYLQMRIDWEKFYKQFFKRSIDFSTVEVPKRPGDMYRLVIIAKGITLGKIAKVWPVMNVGKLLYASNLHVSRHDLLDRAVPTNSRTTVQHYAVWVKHSVEADVRFRGKTAFQADIKMDIGMTLLERLVLELKYWNETGGAHLDVIGGTICSSSRDMWGKVPVVSFMYDRNNKNDVPDVFLNSVNLDEIQEPNDGIRKVVSF